MSEGTFFFFKNTPKHQDSRVFRDKKAVAENILPCINVVKNLEIGRKGIAVENMFPLN